MAVRFIYDQILHGITIFLKLCSNNFWQQQSLSVPSLYPLPYCADWMPTGRALRPCQGKMTFYISLVNG